MANIVSRKEKEMIRAWTYNLNTKNLFLKLRGSNNWNLKAELIDDCISKFPIHIVYDYEKIKFKFIEEGYNGIIQLINNSSWKYETKINKNNILIFLDEYIKIEIYKKSDKEFQKAIDSLFNLIKNGLYFCEHVKYYSTIFYDRYFATTEVLLDTKKRHIGIIEALRLFEHIKEIYAYTDFFWYMENNTFKLYNTTAVFAELDGVLRKRYYTEVYEVRLLETSPNLDLGIPNIKTPFDIIRTADEIRAGIRKLPNKVKKDIKKVIEDTLKSVDKLEAIFIDKDTVNKKIYVLIVLNELISLLFDFYIPFIVFNIGEKSRLYRKLRSYKTGDRIDVTSYKYELLDYIIYQL